jgi:hypothetical protein
MVYFLTFSCLMQTFPQYRRYSNKGSYFKIQSLELMYEKKQLGSKYLFFEIQAERYYEKLQIQDLLNCTFENIEISDEADYEFIKCNI